MKQDYEEKLYEAVKEVAKDLPLQEAARIFNLLPNPRHQAPAKRDKHHSRDDKFRHRSEAKVPNRGQVK